MFEKSKETNNLVLRDLQDEIKSLKSLVLNRMSLNNQIIGSPSPASSIVGENKPNEVKRTINEIDSSLSSRFPFLGQNPSIPAWQVSGASSNTEEKEKKKKKKKIKKKKKKKISQKILSIILRIFFYFIYSLIYLTNYFNYFFKIIFKYFFYI